MYKYCSLSWSAVLIAGVVFLLPGCWNAQGVPLGECIKDCDNSDDCRRHCRLIHEPGDRGTVTVLDTIPVSP